MFLTIGIRIKHAVYTIHVNAILKSILMYIFLQRYCLIRNIFFQKGTNEHFHFGIDQMQ